MPLDEDVITGLQIRILDSPDFGMSRERRPREAECGFIRCHVAAALRSLEHDLAVTNHGDLGDVRAIPRGKGSSCTGRVGRRRRGRFGRSGDSFRRRRWRRRGTERPWLAERGRRIAEGRRGCDRLVRHRRMTEGRRQVCRRVRGRRGTRRVRHRRMAEGGCRVTEIRRPGTRHIGRRRVTESRCRLGRRTTRRTAARTTGGRRRGGRTGGRDRARDADVRRHDERRDDVGGAGTAVPTSGMTDRSANMARNVAEVGGSDMRERRSVGRRCTRQGRFGFSDRRVDVCGLRRLDIGPSGRAVRRWWFDC